MLVFIIDSCSKSAVREVIEDLYDILGHEVFNRCFPVILTDNSSEFKSPNDLELNAQGIQRTKIFYCDPLASYKKPHLEKNHEYIRYIIPQYYLNN